MAKPPKEAFYPTDAPDAALRPLAVAPLRVKWELGVGGVSVALFNADGDPVQIGGGPLTSQTSSTSSAIVSRSNN